MRILMTGASGFVGRHLAPRLVSSGHDVTKLKRGTDAGQGAEASPEVITGPSDFAALRPDHVADHPPFDAVIHLAALNPDRGRGETSNDHALIRANRDGSLALFRVVEAHGARHFVFLSTANVHAPSDRPIDEASPIAPLDAYARSKAMAETALLAAAKTSRTRLTILRPAPVYGEGGRGMIALLKRLAASPWPLPLPATLGERSFVSVEALSSAIIACLDRDGMGAETYLVADAEPVTPAALTARLRTTRGRAPGLIPLPNAILRAAAGVAGKGQSFQRLSQGFRIDPRKLRHATGWSPEPDTLAAILRQSADTGRTRQR